MKHQQISIFYITPQNYKEILSEATCQNEHQLRFVITQMYSPYVTECQFEDWQECNNTCDAQQGYQSRYTTEDLCPCVNVSTYYETRACYNTSKQPCQGKVDLQTY